MLKTIYEKRDVPLSIEDIHIMAKGNHPQTNSIQTRTKTLHSKNANQAQYIHQLATKTLNFAVGPAGTGKTYLSVAKAVEAFETAKVERMVFVRPAVEAGEKLGFLPGDMVEKVLPYLRPIYDALYDLLGVQTVEKLIQQDSIEIAPLAFMRGRTLNDAFIILDEAQNSTITQMKMFLTRMGFGSQMVVTGDVTQSDLPKNIRSGLSHAMGLLRNFNEVGVTQFDYKDVVRHALVGKIIAKYENDKNNK